MDTLNANQPRLPRPESVDLFRPEALPGRRYQAPTITVAPPVSLLWVSIMLGVLFICVLIAVFFAKYTQKVPAHAWLLPDSGLIQIYAPQEGIVTRSYLQDGARVKKGDPLFVVSAERTTEQLGHMGPLTLDTIETQIAKLREGRHNLLQLQTDNKNSSKRHVQMLAEELAAAHKERDLAQGRFQLSVSRQARMNTLWKENLVSTGELEQEKASALATESAFHVSERAVAALDDEINKALADAAAQSRDRYDGMLAMDREITALEGQKNDHALVMSSSVLAPADAVVSSQTAVIGSTVNPNLSVAVLLPENQQLRIHALVDEDLAGRVRTGQAVSLRLRSNQHRPYTTYIDWISPAPLNEQQIGLKFGINGHASAYEVIMPLPSGISDQETNYIYRPGAQLNIDIHLQTRSIGDWVLRGLLGETEGDKQ